MKNIAIEYSNNQAVISEKDLEYVPQLLQSYIGKKVKNDEKAFYEPCMSAIFSNAKTYSVKLT